jgi:hypothetical protein
VHPQTAPARQAWIIRVPHPAYRHARAPTDLSLFGNPKPKWQGVDVAGDDNRISAIAQLSDDVRQDDLMAVQSAIVSVALKPIPLSIVKTFLLMAHFVRSNQQFLVRHSSPESNHT